MDTVVVDRTFNLRRAIQLACERLRSLAPNPRQAAHAAALMQVRDPQTIHDVWAVCSEIQRDLQDQPRLPVFLTLVAGECNHCGDWFEAQSTHSCEGGARR